MKIEIETVPIIELSADDLDWMGKHPGRIRTRRMSREELEKLFPINHHKDGNRGEDADAVKDL